MAEVRVQRLDFGYFVRPAGETGTGRERVEPCLGYLVTHPGGVLLFDTRMGCDPEVDAYYRPRRVGLVEALAGVFLVPAPGHTAGHQSLVVRGADGAVVVAGQSHDTAPGYAADQAAWGAHREGQGQQLPAVPDWIGVLQRFDPRVVYFAYDRSVWVP